MIAAVSGNDGGYQIEFSYKLYVKCEKDFHGTVNAAKLRLYDCMLVDDKAPGLRFNI